MSRRVASQGSSPHLTRRGFLAALPVLGLSGRGRGASGAPLESAADFGVEIMTVTGPVPARELGRTLPHEHVTTDFLGAERLPAPRYDAEAAFATIRGSFADLRSRGVDTLVECTPAYIGRDPVLLRRLSLATGLRVVTNTGYYGAVDNKFLPRHAHDESVGELADRWQAEWERGIGDTGIRPGFIKLGTGAGRLPDLHVKLLRAACRVHRRSGLTIAFHSGDGLAARHEVEILATEGVAPDALIWVHAQNDAGPIQLELARRGVWVSLDGYSLAHRNPERYVQLLLDLKREGLLRRVLVSHDDGWAVEGEVPRGATLKLFGNGNPRPYVSVFDRFLPDLREKGFTPEDEKTLLVVNPAAAFGIRRRLA